MKTLSQTVEQHHSLAVEKMKMFSHSDVKCRRCGSAQLIWNGPDTREFDTERGVYTHYVKNETIPCLDCGDRMLDLLSMLSRTEIERSKEERLTAEKNPIPAAIERARNDKENRIREFNRTAQQWGFDPQEVWNERELRRKAKDRHR